MVVYRKNSDQELLSLLKEGDQSAFAEIYYRYWSLLYMHALKMLRNEEDARDVVQELFTTLWGKAGAISSGDNLAGFLYISVRNKVLDLIAHQKVRNSHLESLGLFLEQHQDTVFDALSQKDLMAILDKEIEQLPPKMKAVFKMRIKNHMSYKEIAEKLDVSDKTVKKQVNNAIKIIKLRINTISGIVILLESVLKR